MQINFLKRIYIEIALKTIQLRKSSFSFYDSTKIQHFMTRHFCNRCWTWSLLLNERICRMKEKKNNSNSKYMLLIIYSKKAFCWKTQLHTFIAKTFLPLSQGKKKSWSLVRLLYFLQSMLDVLKPSACLWQWNVTVFTNADNWALDSFMMSQLYLLPL